jgi:hypothetical protein
MQPINESTTFCRNSIHHNRETYPQYRDSGTRNALDREMEEKDCPHCSPFTEKIEGRTDVLCTVGGVHIYLVFTVTFLEWQSRYDYLSDLYEGRE